MTHDGPPPRHLQPVEPPYDPEYDERPRTTARLRYDPDAERAILALLLQHPTTVDTLTQHIDGTDLYQPTHEQIWDTWHQLHTTDGVPPDAIVLASHLRKTNQTQALQLLPDLATTTVVPALASAYATTVRDHARLRQLDELTTQLAQISREGRLDTLDRTLADGLDAIGDAAMRFTTTRATTSQWAPLDLTQVLNGQEVDPPPALLARTDGNCLLYAGAIHTISGEPGSGKTWVTLAAAHQELRKGNTVTMVDFEDRASRVVGRLLRLGTTLDEIQNQFRYIRPHTALDPGTDRTALEHAVHGTSLVILDGVTEAMTLHGLDLNANSDVATFYALLPRWIADHGPAVVMIDHVVKDGEKQGRWALGGQHKLAGIDGVAYLVKAIEPFGRGKTGLARITVSKDRPGYVEELALGRTVAEFHLDARDINCLRHSIDAPSALPTDDAGEMRPTHLMEKVSRYVEITPGANRGRIVEGVTGKAPWLRRALDRLIQEGYIEVTAGPNRQQFHRVTTPFREDEDALHERPGWQDQEPLS